MLLKGQQQYDINENVEHFCQVMHVISMVKLCTNKTHIFPLNLKFHILFFQFRQAR